MLDIEVWGRHPGQVPEISQSRSQKSGIGTHLKIRDKNRDSNSKFEGRGLGQGLKFEKSDEKSD